jgi:mannan endo-1,4-beta-mannosidase
MADTTTTTKTVLSFTIPAAVILAGVVLTVNGVNIPVPAPPVAVADAGPPPGPLPPPGHPRPAGNTGTGFFVDSGKVYDASGVEFVMRGIATTLWWGHQDRNRLAVPEIGKTGANVIRMVFGPGMGEDTPAEQQVVIAAAIQSKTVPVVTDMGATCKTDQASLDAVVGRWLEPDRVTVLKGFEKNLILNVANEWGSFDGAVWRDAYVSVIKKLRAAGIHSLLMIDAGGACGQNPRSIRDFGADVLAGDPDHNVMFSIHAYSYHRTAEAADVGRWNDAGSQSPWRTKDELVAIKAKGLAVAMGEVGWEGSPQVAYKTKSMLLDLKGLGVGFLAWSWSQNSDSALDLLKYASPTNYLYRVEDLSPAGQLFILDPDVGVAATAKKATF